MKYLNPQELKVGMVLAEDVKTQAGQVLAKKGDLVDRILINRMKLYRLTQAGVEQEEAASKPKQKEPEVEPKKQEKEEPPKKEEPKKKPEKPVLGAHIRETKTAKQRVAESNEFRGFQMEYYTAIQVLKKAFSDAIEKQIPLNPDALLEAIRPLYSQRNTIVELFDMLNNLRALDDPIYAHSINVALVARMLGRWLKFDKTKLDIITQAGLIHDIGKCLVPEEILNKSGKLTDEEFAKVRSHPKLGYQLIKGMDLDSHIKKATLQHHERCDGSGYPSGLDEDNIDDVAMIIAIADVYDAMTAARTYRTPLCAFQVIYRFEEEGYAKYPTKYIMTFLTQIASTYQSNRVVLSDGRACSIVMLNKNDLSRPVVSFDDKSWIDLSKQRELYISAII